MPAGISEGMTMAQWTNTDMTQRYQRAQAVQEACARHPDSDEMSAEDETFWASMILSAKDIAARLAIPRALVLYWFRHGRLELMDFEEESRSGRPIPLFFLPHVADRVLQTQAHHPSLDQLVAQMPDELWDHLLRQLPINGRWTVQRRSQWLTAMTAVLDLLIAVDDPPACRTRSAPQEEASVPAPAPIKESTPYEAVIDSVVAVLQDAGGPLHITALAERVGQRRGYYTLGGTESACFVECKHPKARVIRVAPRTYGLANQDPVVEHPPQWSRQATPRGTPPYLQTIQAARDHDADAAQMTVITTDVPEAEDEDLITAEEAQTQLGVEPATVRSWVKRHQLTGRGVQQGPLGRPAQRFRRDEIVALIQAPPTEPSQPPIEVPGERVIETARRVLDDVGHPLSLEALYPLVVAQRRGGTMGGLSTALYAEQRQQPPAILKVAPNTWGIVGRDAVEPDASQRPRPQARKPRQEPKDKQARWRQKQRVAGRCERCGEPSGPYALCQVHRAEHRERERERVRRQPTLVTSGTQETPEGSPGGTGDRECLRCDAWFTSPDRVRVRICPACKRSDEWRMADEL